MRRAAFGIVKARAAGRAVQQARAQARAADLAATIKELQAAGAESLRAIGLALTHNPSCMRWLWKPAGGLASNNQGASMPR
jgi:hypothetical protein